MESQTSKKAEELRRQVELRQQIALLQAQLIGVPELDQVQLSLSPKRKQPEQSILAPATPSPKKKRKLSHDVPLKANARSEASISQRSNSITRDSRSIFANKGTPLTPVSVPTARTASTLITRLAGLGARPIKIEFIVDRVTRSTGFSEKPAAALAPATGSSNIDDIFEGEDRGVKRDDRLAIIEDLKPGPYDHIPPFDDPRFERYEPHSSIRLSSRNIPHEDFQDYLRGRYYLSPSRLYSVIRLLPNKQGYDVPVEGDWVTIAVVAERGPIKFSKAPVGLGHGDGEDDGRKGKQPAKADDKRKSTDERAMSHGKKYVNLKLIDFGCRTRSSNSHTGGQATIRGDAFLSLLLFESDGFDTVTNSDTTREQKIYKGGSKGAFESIAKLREGAVVALLNPKVLKPFQRSNDSLHPTSNILALTPESASSIAIIGYASDLGMCTVMQKDGRVCGKWVDKRTSEVCEWHVQIAIERRRAGRAEFSSGTSGMSMSAVSKKTSAYDPARQWGLKPEDSGTAGATYVVSGHVISGSSSDSRSMHVGEAIGREAQAKASRISKKEADRALKALLEKDKDGIRAVVKAREVGSRDKTRDENVTKKIGDIKSKIKDDDVTGGRSLQKNAYSADIIKKLGFDPTAKAGNRNDNDVMKKLDSLAISHSSKPIELGSRPDRLRSCVLVPPSQDANQPASSSSKAGSLLPSKEGMIDLDSSDME